MVILAPLNRCSKNIRVVPVVVPELKLRNVQRHIFGANFVERADHAALKDRPEAFNRVGVDCADYILMIAVADDFVRVFWIEFVEHARVVSDKRRNFVRNNRLDEFADGFKINVVDCASDHVSLAAHGTDDRLFARTFAAGSAAFLVPMPIPVFTANVGLVHFDNAPEFIKVALGERSPNPVAHVPSGFVGAEPHVAINLECAHSLFAGEHQVSDLEPIAKRLIRVLKNRSCDVREAIGRVFRALVALPMPRVALQLRGILGATARTADAFGPAFADKISAARFFIREELLELRGGKLVDVLFGSHGPVPFDLGSRI